jgi:hypothetical protein
MPSINLTKIKVLYCVGILMPMLFDKNEAESHSEILEKKLFQISHPLRNAFIK